MSAPQRIAVTGASGFIGAAIARALMADGHEVLPFGRRPASALTGAQREALPNYRSWDLGDDRAGSSNTSGDSRSELADPSAVVHCAATVGQWGADADYVRGNVTGTANLLRALSPEARVVFISSASVYDKSNGASLSENSPLLGSGANAYARTKAAAERLVLARGAAATVLRPHIVYGPGDTTLWPRLRAAVRGTVLRVPGNGAARVSTTHLEHLTQAVRLALKPGAATGCFNIADAEPQSVRTLLSTVFARQGIPVTLQFVPRPVAWSAALAYELTWRALGKSSEPPLTRYAVKSLADDCVLDISRARRELGYAPRWTIADGPL